MLTWRIWRAPNNAGKWQMGFNSAFKGLRFIPTLLYGSETWAIREEDKSRITSAEMEFMQRTAKYTWQDYKTN